jgi:hypothetical protein
MGTRRQDMNNPLDQRWKEFGDGSCDPIQRFLR